MAQTLEKRHCSGLKGSPLEKRCCPLPLPLRESHLAKIIILALSGKFLFNLPADCKQLA